MNILKSLWLTVTFVAIIDLDIVQCLRTDKKGKGRRERKRCSKVCTQKLKEESNKLKAEIDSLKQQVRSLSFGLQGPRGPPGQKGDVGLAGKDGRAGYPGLPGAKGSSGTISSHLPTCVKGEYLWSNGKSLQCVKLDLNGLSVGDRSTTRQHFPPKPTMAPEMRKKMTKFMKKYMIQFLYTDTWDLGVFTHKSLTFLGVSQLGSKSFVIYQWINRRFFQHQVLKVENARMWKSFEHQGSRYLAVASNVESIGSPVFKLHEQSRTFYEFQKIYTTKAFDVETIKTDNYLFLAYAFYYGDVSYIYRWDTDRFVKHQEIATNGADVESFKIGDRTFLAYVGPNTREPSVYIYELRRGAFFYEYKRVPIEEKVTGLKYVSNGNDHFLAIARYQQRSSFILKWNGRTFIPFQILPSCRARDFVSITVKSQTYLGLINSGCKPVIYVWDNQHTKQFVKLQEVDSTVTRDMEFFEMGSSVYLAVSSHRRTNIYRGAIE